MLLGAGVAQHALVWRRGFKPEVRVSSATEHTLVRALQAGLALDAALTSACGAESNDNSTAFDFNDWLAQAVQTGLVTGAHLLNATSHTAQHPGKNTS